MSVAYQTNGLSRGVVMETERMTLRRFTAADVDNLYALHNDPAVMRYLNGGKPTPREVIEHETLPWILSLYERYEHFGRWAAIERGTGEFMGWFGLRPPNDATLNKVEMGYRLRRAVWGRGLATEGARALVHWAFSDWGVQRVSAQTMTVNVASRRVMEKAGLRYVRTFFAEWPEVIEGSELGDVEYALTRSEWEQRIAPCG